MKAIYFEKHGGPEVFKLGSLPDPEPPPGHALVKVEAVALNFLDIWVRRGWPGLSLKLPHIPGSDIAGEVMAVNTTSEWRAGMKVVINPGVVTVEDEWTRRGEDSVSPGYKIIGEDFPGGLAQYVVVPVGNMFLRPDTLPAEEACAPLLVGTTVWRMLFKRGALQAGETVLVVGSGGGVNSLAIMLAASVGANVIALAGGSEKAEQALRLGAQHVIDYKKVSNWHVEVLKLTRGRGVDLVVDNVGQSTIPMSLRAVRRGGRIVVVGNTSGFNVAFDNRLIFAKQISIIGSTMGSKQDFMDMLSYIWAKGLRIPIDTVETLDRGIDMLARLESGKQFGKIVIKPW